jgi:protoporphyrinogen oxidase
MNYDYVVIGGGIGGLYCVEKLVEKYKNTKKILLLDERSYFGGRLITHKKPTYEIGGARFNNNHKLLLKLIHKYKLNKIKLSPIVDFIYKSKNDVTYYKDANKTFDMIMKNIIMESKKYKKEELIKITLKQFIDNISETTQLSKKLIDIFGYNSEITKMNAYDSLRSFDEDFTNKNFYVLKEGFSTLCDLMVIKNKDKVEYKLNHKVNNIKKGDNIFEIICNNQKTNKNYSFNSKKIILAVKSEQLRQFNILKPVFPYLKCLYNAPLLRIYAKYPINKTTKKAWFCDLPRLTTNSFLRHIIPIDANSGLIMISYTDGSDTNVFLQDKTSQKLKDEETIKNMIQDELKLILPKYNIPQPTYFKTHMWNVGAHHWKPNCNSKEIQNEVKNPLKDVYIIGEAFSQKQAWAEGSLESVESIIDKL